MAENKESKEGKENKEGNEIRESKLTPEQKAAAVVVSLGADKASKIYKHLSESDIERLTIEVAKLGHVSPDEMELVLDEFYKTCLTQKVVTDGGMEYARAVLEKAFGESTAQSLLDKLSKSLQIRPFDFIRKSNVKNLISFLQHERPQTIALVLSYADSDQASMVISELPKEKRIKVVEAIARMESAPRDPTRTTFSTNWARRTKNLQRLFERRCSYSKILCLWTTDQYRDSSASAMSRILYTPSRDPTRISKNLSSPTYLRVWRRVFSPTLRSQLMCV